MVPSGSRKVTIDNSAFDSSAPRLHARWALVEIALIFVVFAIHGAWPVPDVNEPYYLGKAIHFWNPHWLAGDFFMESPDTHKVFYFAFGWLSLWLSPVALAWTGRTIGWALLAWAWRRLSFAVVPRAWWAVLTAALFGCLTERCPMAGEWVIGGVEAKVFAYAFVFLGLESLLRNRWNRALVLFGVAAAFHALVGGWAVVAAGVAWLFTRWKKSPSPCLPLSPSPRLLSLWPGLLAGLLLALPGIIPSLALDWGVDRATARAAHEIYVFERLPHHLTLSGMRPEFIGRLVLLWAFWMLLGHWSRRDHLLDKRQPLALLRAFVTGAVVITLAGAAVNLLVIFDRGLAADFLRYYFYRLTDVMLPLGVALEIVALIVDRLDASKVDDSIEENSRELTARGRCNRSRAVDAASRRVVWPLRSLRPSQESGETPLLRLPTCERLRGRLARMLRGPLAPGYLLLLIAVIPSAWNLGDHAWQRLHPGPPRADRLPNFTDWRATCRWVADSGRIPAGAKFLVPRDAQTFKWYTGRSDVVNWKDVPQDAKSILEWWRRFQDIYATGLAEPRWHDPLTSVGAKRIKELGAKYHADYLLSERIPPVLRERIPVSHK